MVSPSFENVEKVVNPPQKPTMRNKEKDGETFWKRLVAPHRIPMRRQPATLIVKVPHGKPLRA
jgi:hypothetical protein